MHKPTITLILGMLLMAIILIGIDQYTNREVACYDQAPLSEVK